MVRGSFPQFINPAVGLEPAKGFHDALLDGEIGFPAGRLNFFGLEKNKRVVADPAAVAPGVTQLRFQAERPADEADAVLDLNILGRAEIVDLSAMFGVARGAEAGDVQDRIDAVLYVKVTFALGAVAEHLEPGGMLGELLVEIKDMAVRVTFT